MKIQRFPFLNFIVKDSPYLCHKNVFRYRFHIPIHLFVREGKKITNYSMLKDCNKFDINIFHHKLETLLKEHTINNQTLTIDKNSLKVDYLLPFIINKEKLYNTVIIPNNLSPVDYNNICNMDIFIPLSFGHGEMFINRPIWYKN